MSDEKPKDDRWLGRGLIAVSAVPIAITLSFIPAFVFNLIGL